MLKQFNEVMSCIEQHLPEEITAEQIARIAGCSEYHFRRMFSFLSGMSLGEYIRRRKLSLAGELLQTQQGKVIDIALQLGYASPEAFAKAFQAMHGIAPSQARKEAAELKAFPPMSFQLTIRGGADMNYRLVEKNRFQVVGFKKRVPLQFNGVNPAIESLAQRLTPEIVHQLKSLCNTEPAGILNVSAHFKERTVEGSELDQYIGVATTKDAPENYDVLKVESSAWAVFKVVGAFPQAVQETWAKIYAEWLPSAAYELTGGPEMLWNEGPDMSKPDYRSEIWIPVRRLNQS